MISKLITRYTPSFPLLLPYYRKTKLISRRARFVSPPRRKEEALDEKQISIFAAIIGLFLLSSLLLAATRCLLYLSYSRGEGSGEEDTVVDSRRRSASEMNFIAQLGSFIGKISCASARKPPEVDIGAVVLDGSLLSLSLSLSLSLVFFGRSYFHSCMERSIDLITCRFSGNQILSYVSFQAMNDRTIQFSFFWFKVLRFFSREYEISEILNVSLFI